MENNTEQFRIVHKLSPEQKYRAAMNLLTAAIKLKEASLISWYPEMSEEDRRRALRDFVLYART